MRLVSDPASIDVLLTENLFGDILSDEAGGAGRLAGPAAFRLPGRWTGSLRAGAWLGARHRGARHRRTPSAPSPPRRCCCATGSTCREAAEAVEQAIAAVLAAGARTPDIARPGERTLGTERDRSGDRAPGALGRGGRAGAIGRSRRRRSRSRPAWHTCGARPRCSAASEASTPPAAAPALPRRSPAAAAGARRRW